MTNGPDPAKYAEQGSEHAHQVALFMWAASPEVRTKYPQLEYMFAIPNGGERNKAVASKLKAEGVKKGVVDIFLPVPVAGWHGLFIEMKKPGETPTDKQKEFMDAMKAKGYGAVCCDHWTKARDTIVAYLTYGC